MIDRLNMYMKHLIFKSKEETTVRIPINFAECKTLHCSIGVKNGGSGTGKTTLLT